MYKRIVVLFFAFCVIMGVLSARLVIINEGGDDAAAYTANTISTVAASSRGYIYDCNLVPLVNNEAEIKIAIKPTISSLAAVSYAVSDDDKQTVYNEVSNGKIGIAAAKENISEINGNCFSAVRRYQDDGICVHLVGYTDYDGNGVCGIEKYYNSLLTQSGGYLKAKCSVDAKGKALEGTGIETVSVNYNSKAGVALTIDSRIQKICEDALLQFGIEQGAAVVLDTETSEIRAMASTPEYSQNSIFESLENDKSPFINRAVTPYSVGSVFKVVVATAAVEQGITTSESFNCNGFTMVGTTRFGCHKKDGHGTLDMFGGMAQSCNPYFIQLALKTGKKSICDMGKNLGLGTKIELADGWYTESGIMPDEQSIVSEQDLANLAFGQGSLLASPLQMAAVYAAVANDGVYRAPSLMQSVINENRVETMRAELPVSRRVMSEETAKIMQSLLNETVKTGSGSKAKPDGIDVAGKTATAQSGQFNENGEEITQSWFCGYFPYEMPQYSVVILKENGTGGSADCAPVFKYIAQNIAELN